MDKHAELTAYLANATQNAFACLMKCLLNNGALKPDQFTNAIKATFNAPDADWGRPDYMFLRELARTLEEAEIAMRRRPSD